MKNIKKFVTTTILSAALIATSSISIFASPFNDVADTVSYKDAVVRLYGLGIIQGNNGNFNPDNNIIRGDLAKVILNAIGKGKLTSLKSKLFEDVTSKDYYAGYVNIAAQLGVMSGSIVNGKKYFKPKDNVKLSELATIVIRCLGYKDSDLEGEWPFNYISKATDLNLFDGVNNIDPDYKVTRSDVAVIINNMLNAPTKTESTKDNPKSFFELTKSKFGVKTDTGAIITSQFDSTIASNHVKVNNVDYEVGLSNPQDLLSNAGKIATVYIKDNKIIFATNVQGISKSVIATRDASSGVIYFKDAGSTQEQTATISANAKIILNGKIATNITSIKNGANIILVNNDSNADYDYVIATQMSAPIIITSDITTDDPIVVSNSVAGLNLRKIDGTAAQVTVTGAATKLSQIRRYDVVYPAASESNDVISLYVVRSAVSGIVTATLVPTINSLGRVTIAGNTYNVKQGININLGDNKTFLLDKDNTIIAYIDNGLNQTTATAIPFDHYGVITGSRIAKDDWTGASTYQVKFTKLDGTDITLQTTGYIDINAYRNQLVSYSLNSSNVAIIQAVGYSPLRKINIVSDTAIYAVITNLDGSINKIQKVNPTDLSLIDSMALYAVVKPNNLMGDYSMLVLVNPTFSGSISTDISGYGCVIGKTGSALASDGVTAVDVYDVFIGGAKQSVNVKKDSILPSVFSKLISTGGVVTSGLDVASNYKYVGKVVAIDALNYKIRVNDAIYILDSSVKVYNVSNNVVKLASLGDVTTDMANNATVITDPTSGKVVMIIINK